jgi:hypothetical protein
MPVVSDYPATEARAKAARILVTILRLTSVLAASAARNVRGKPPTELVGFWYAEFGVDVQGGLPMAAGPDMIALCVVGAAEAVVGPCMLEPVANLAGEFEGVCIRPAGHVRAACGQADFAEADVCLGRDRSLPDLGRQIQGLAEVGAGLACPALP